MRRKHVYFGNDVTYHFYCWLTASGHLNAATMIDQAFERAIEEPAPFESQPLDTVQWKLTDDLRGWFQEHCWPLSGAELLPGEYTPGEFGDVEEPREAILMALLGWAASQIQWHVVAEALLRDCGKWNPDQFAVAHSHDEEGDA